MPIGTAVEAQQNPDYDDNFGRMKAIVDQLKTHVNRIILGGDARARDRHTSRGKLLARDRIDRLLDPGSPFLEFSQLAAHGVYGKEDVPCAGIITGENCVVTAGQLFFDFTRMNYSRRGCSGKGDTIGPKVVFSSNGTVITYNIGYSLYYFCPFIVSLVR